MSNNSTAAKDGGANQSKTTMPPVSKEYRDNYDEIFRKKDQNVECSYGTCTAEEARENARKFYSSLKPL